VENPTKRAFQDRIGRIEDLIKGVDEITDEKVRRQSRELVEALLELQGAGLERVMEIIYDSGLTGQAAIDELGRDELVSSLLLVHGLHPLDLEARVRRALEEVKPRLGLHGGSVELLGVTSEGRVQLKLEGNCHECPSSRLTLRFSIEEALNAAAPDLTGLDVEGLAEEHPKPAANGGVPIPKFTDCPLPNGAGQPTQPGRTI
jgi:Fe-S cluster biogenesis protein NfuA